MLSPWATFLVSAVWSARGQVARQPLLGVKLPANQKEFLNESHFKVNSRSATPLPGIVSISHCSAYYLSKQDVLGSEVHTQTDGCT